MVAKPVSKAEVRQNPEAQKAIAKEWQKLRDAGYWDESTVVERSAIADSAVKTNKVIHIGTVHGLCYLKGPELPEGAKGRQF